MIELTVRAGDPALSSSSTSHTIRVSDPKAVETVWNALRARGAVDQLPPGLAAVRLRVYDYTNGNVTHTATIVAEVGDGGRLSRDITLSVTTVGGDPFRPVVAKGAVVVLQRAGIDKPPINNALYVSRYDREAARWTHRFLADVHPDAAVTVAIAANTLLENVRDVEVDVPGRLRIVTHFTNDYGIHLVTIDHDIPIDRYLATRAHCNAETLRRLGLDPADDLARKGAAADNDDDGSDDSDDDKAEKKPKKGNGSNVDSEDYKHEDKDPDGNGNNGNDKPKPNKTPAGVLPPPPQPARFAQEVTLSFLDMTAYGVAPVSPAQVVRESDGATVMLAELTPDDNNPLCAPAFPSCGPFGRFLRFRLDGRNVVAELISVEDFLAGELTTVDILDMTNEYWGNPRLTISSSRARIIHRGKTYTVIQTALVDFMRDIAAALVRDATVKYDDLSTPELLTFLTAYVYVNRASRRVAEAVDTSRSPADRAASRTAASQCFTIAQSNTTTRNAVDVANQVIALNRQLFESMLAQLG